MILLLQLRFSIHLAITGIVNVWSRGSECQLLLLTEKSSHR
uniref:Uncharacterized protein n=1 Tax=Anguilla anguilla TaxID=7936 RepID=A0A0E9SG42_ANGAN